MKVLIDGRCLVHEGMDGVRRYTTELLKQFDRLGYGYDLAKPTVRGRWLEQLWEHLALPLKARKHDVLFCPANVAPVWVPKQVRLVVTVHSLSFLQVPEIYGRAFRAYYTWLMPRVVRRADAVLTVSKAEAAVIEQAYPFAKGKVTAIPLGVAEEFTPGDPARKRDEILFVGNLGPGKGLRTLLEAFAGIAGRVPHRLVVVGASFQAFREQGGLVAGLSDEVLARVDWVGQVEDPGELAGYYRRAAVFVFPSLYESFGLPVAEAMACGTAVVVSDLPALRETVGEAGVFVRGGDAGALGEALGRVLGSGGIVGDLRTRGAVRAGEFRWEAAAIGAWGVLGGK